MNDEIGTFVKLYDSSGYVCVVGGDEGSIDAAVERWVASGGTANALLCLTLLDGCTYRVKASEITSWFVTTPATRSRAVEMDKLLDDERQENRRAVGLYESE